MKEERKENEVLRFADLAKAYNSTDHYALWKLFEEANISSDMQRMILGSEIKQMTCQEDYIKSIESTIQDQKQNIATCDMKYKNALKEYEEAIQKLHVAEEALEILKQYKMKAENMIERLQKALEKEKRKRERMKLYVLVHPTATLTSVDKKKEALIVCTKYDIERMHFKQLVDKVEDVTTFEEVLDADIPEKAFEEISSQEEFESAIHYIKMAVRYWIENKPFELLYNDAGIKYILDSMNLF